MRIKALTTTAAILASLALAGGALAAREQSSSEKQEESSSSTSSSSQSQAGQQQIRPVSELEKFNVQSTEGQKVGKVNKVVVDMDQGRIAYVLVNAQEGGGNYIIPWKALQSDPQQKTLTLNKSPEQLRQAPKGEIQAIDRQMGRRIHEFYGVSPYWEERGSSSGQ